MPPASEAAAAPIERRQQIVQDDFQGNQCSLLCTGHEGPPTPMNPLSDGAVSV